jgi:hypothetical protein
MKHLKQFNENISSGDVSELKSLISELPPMRWNIGEKDEDNSDFPYGYFGDEWDNWEHMEENERAEYFAKIFNTVKKLKDKIESL